MNKGINPAWVTIDVLTCIIPVCLCIPILIDAISGAWYDVPPALYRGYAYRPYYRYTAYRVIPRTYFCTEW